MQLTEKQVVLLMHDIWHKTEGILDNNGGSENSGNPVSIQVDNFPVGDGEVDQPIYEGPQTRSCSKKLMKANILMDRIFDIDQSPIPEVVDNPESLRDLILEFWYQQVSQYIWSVVTWLKLLSHSFSGGGG